MQVCFLWAPLFLDHVHNRSENVFFFFSTHSQLQETSSHYRIKQKLIWKSDSSKIAQQIILGYLSKNFKSQKS